MMIMGKSKPVTDNSTDNDACSVRITECEESVRDDGTNTTDPKNQTGERRYMIRAG